MLKPVFIAHRGYAAAFPENTLIALDAARQAGARYVEVDIQLSADKVPVLFHDRDLKRLCRQTGAIHDYDLSRLEKFNVTDAQKFADKYSNNKITTLNTFVDYLKKHPELKAFIELKRSMIEKFTRDSVLQVILPLFEGMHDQVTFISYDQAILKIIHDTTGYSTGIVVDDWNEYDKKLDWTPEWLFCSAEGLPEDNSELAIKSDIAVFEVGTTALAKKLLAKGICYLETFRIKEMIEAFAADDGG